LEEVGRGKVGRKKVGLEGGWREMCVAGWNSVFRDGMGGTVEEGILVIMQELTPLFPLSTLSDIAAWIPQFLHYRILIPFGLP
jgi:hypothetical protein